MRERVYASVFFFHEDDSLSFTNDLFTKSDMVLATSGVGGIPSRPPQDAPYRISLFTLSECLKAVEL
jgi:hypothetical protein